MTEVDRLFGEYRIRQLTSDWPFAEQRLPFWLPPARNRVERIAQDYFRDTLEWPDAMEKLLVHYRSMGEVNEAAKVAVLLAEAFPYEAERQLAAVELLHGAGRPEERVYLARALEVAGSQETGVLLARRKASPDSR